MQGILEIADRATLLKAMKTKASRIPAYLAIGCEIYFQNILSCASMKEMGLPRTLCIVPASGVAETQLQDVPRSRCDEWRGPPAVLIGFSCCSGI